MINARRIFLCALLLWPAALGAVEASPQWWSLEFKAGVWMPTDTTTRDSLGSVTPTGSIEYGYLYKSKFGAELGVGMVLEDGTAFGGDSGEPSGDKFDLLLIPIHTSFAFRADFKEDQLLVPYVKAGPDFVIFRESLSGSSTSGVKCGLHGAAGLQILLDGIEEFGDAVTAVNDVYFTIEGRYAWVNNFGGAGLDLSNLTATGGILIEF